MNKEELRSMSCTKFEAEFYLTTLRLKALINAKEELLLELKNTYSSEASESLVNAYDRLDSTYTRLIYEEAKYLLSLQCVEKFNAESIQDKKIKEHTDGIELEACADRLAKNLDAYINGLRKNNNKNNIYKMIEEYEENARNAAAKASLQERNQMNINPDCYVSREIFYQTAVLKNIECLLRQLLIK